MLAVLLLVGCGGPDYDQEVDLKFNDTGKQYGVALGGPDTGTGTIRPIDRGSQRVLLRISGARVEKLRIYVYDEFGRLICSFEIDVKPSSEVTEVNVECGPSDAGAPPQPMADAGAGPDLSPDTTPPDTGPSPCQEYCTAMRRHCPMVYPDGDDDCVATCVAYGWKPGAPGENSIACRRQRAIDSATALDPLFVCYQAGPSGGRFCGQLCENYCLAAAQACPELEGDYAACRSKCTEPFLHPAYRHETGNTMECRIFWLGESLKKHDRTICERLREGTTTAAPLCRD